MRGGPLSHPKVTELLSSFIVSSWNGKSASEADSLPHIWSIYQNASKLDRSHNNVLCFILTPDGKVTSSFPPFLPDQIIPDTPLPPNSATIEKPTQFFISQLHKHIPHLKKSSPLISKRPITLPTHDHLGLTGDTHLILRTKHPTAKDAFRAPVVEVVSFPVTFPSTLRKAYRTDKQIPASAFEPLLRHFHPPAIMQASGQVSHITGTLKIDKNGTISGVAHLTIDDQQQTQISAKVQLKVRLQKSNQPPKITGTINGSYTPSREPHRPQTYTLNATVSPVPPK